MMKPLYSTGSETFAVDAEPRRPNNAPRNDIVHSRLRARAEISWRWRSVSRLVLVQRKPLPVPASCAKILQSSQNASLEFPMPKAYWVVSYRSISDPQKVAAYAKLAPAATASFGARYIARGTARSEERRVGKECRSRW